MKTEITCVLRQYKIGGKEVMNCMRKNGECFTRVATDLGNGEWGIREIYPNKVIDKLYGRKEVYMPEGDGVVQISDGIKSYFPNIKFSRLTQIN